ncbi:MAG TPA: DUF2157 domain-containing protein [Jiangellaceae bacterium]
MNPLVADESSQLSANLDRWVSQGFISREQADRILAAEQATPGRGGPSLLTEALGYVGGVLILVAAIWIGAELWEEMAVAGRLGILAGAAIVLVVGGRAVPARPGTANGRLRAMLWLLSTASFAGLLVQIGEDLFDWRRDEDVVLLAAGGTTIYAAALWSRWRSPLQHAATFIALLITAAVLPSYLDGSEQLHGVAVWIVGVGWLAAAQLGRLHPRWTAHALGTAAVLFGAQSTTGAEWGYPLALVSLAALVGAAVVVGDLVMLGVSAAGAAVIVPSAMSHYFPSGVTGPLAVLIVGVLLVLAAIGTTKRRAKP